MWIVRVSLFLILYTCIVLFISLGRLVFLYIDPFANRKRDITIATRKKAYTVDKKMLFKVKFFYKRQFLFSTRIT